MESERIEELQAALMGYLDTNGRHYGDKTRLEQQVEDLIQALYFRLDQLKSRSDGTERGETTSPKERLADALRQALAGLAAAPESINLVDDEIADDFESVLDLFDLSKIARLRGETAAIRHKRKG